MVTAEKFIAYEVVRRSGETNMWDWEAVMKCDVVLERDDIREIMATYTQLKVKYANVLAIALDEE